MEKEETTKLWFEIDTSRRDRIGVKFDGVPLQAWKLSTRTRNALLRYDPNMTVGGVIRADESIAEIRGIGVKCIKELDAKVSQLLTGADDDIEAWAFAPPPAPKVPPESVNELAVDQLSLLTEPATRTSIDELHLGVNTHDALLRAGITTVGELLGTGDSDLKRIPRLGRGSIKAVKSARATLLDSLTEDNEVNWPKYWEAQDIQLLPEGYASGVDTNRIIMDLPLVVKEVLCQEFDERAWIVVQRRLGLEGTAMLTLEDLGDAFGLSRERIRQIEQGALQGLRRLLIERRYAGKGYHIHPEILLTVQALCSLAATEANQAILETSLLDRVRQTFDLEVEKVKPSLFLLFSLVDLVCVEFDNPSLAPVWGYISPTQRRILKWGVKRLDHLLTKETSLPLREFDILRYVNRGVKKQQKKLSLSQLRWLIDLCSSVERREDGLIWGRFEHLKSRGNQVERLLFDSGRPMSVKAIARRINHRLVPLGHRKVQIRNLGNQISQDGRFIAIGRSGQWGLKQWLHVDTASIVELMEQCLISYNRSATVDEIHSYVAERRPVSRNSIAIYLSTEAMFAKTDRAKWGLAVWAEAQDAKTWNPGQVAEFVAGIFKEHRTGELDYGIVKRALMDATGVNERQAQGLLSINPVVKTRRGREPRGLRAEFQPNYRDELARVGARLPRKRTTLREQVDQAVRGILETMPGKQMALAELVARLQDEFDRPEKTLYQYIAGLDYVERTSIRGSRMKVCRIKGTHEALSFPQVQAIASEDLRRRIERALRFLSEDNVDIGLFMLSKEFEASLKTYLVAVHSKAKLRSIPAKDPRRWRLAGMIDCARENGIITDHTVLHFLRQERNARAHGVMPTLAERRVLMNSAQYTAGMYIDYIKLLDDLLNSLQRT